MIYDLSRVFLGVTYSFPCAWSLTSVNTRSIFTDLVDVGFVSTFYPVRYTWDYAIIFGYLLSLMIYQFYISLVICEYWLLYLFLICSASKTSDHALFLNLTIWHFLSNLLYSFFVLVTSCVWLLWVTEIINHKLLQIWFLYQIHHCSMLLMCYLPGAI